LVWYEVACYAITVTNYCFMWCSGVIKVIVNKCFSIIICYIGKPYFKGIVFNCILNYLGRSIWRLSLQDTFFFWITIYQGFWNNLVTKYVWLFSLEHKLKIWNITKFRIIEFWINQVLLIYAGSSSKLFPSNMNFW
jgi:hypothetical protein